MVMGGSGIYLCLGRVYRNGYFADVFYVKWFHEHFVVEVKIINNLLKGIRFRKQWSDLVGS